MSNDSCAYTHIILNLVGAGSTHDDASSGIIACFIRHYLQQRLIYGQSSDISTSNQNGHMVPNFNKTLMKQGALAPYLELLPRHTYFAFLKPPLKNTVTRQWSAANLYSQCKARGIVGCNVKIWYDLFRQGRN